MRENGRGKFSGETAGAAASRSRPDRSHVSFPHEWEQPGSGLRLRGVSRGAGVSGRGGGDTGGAENAGYPCSPRLKGLFKLLLSFALMYLGAVNFTRCRLRRKAGRNIIGTADDNLKVRGRRPCTRPVVNGVCNRADGIPGSLHMRAGGVLQRTGGKAAGQKCPECGG